MSMRSALYRLLSPNTIINNNGGLYNCLVSNSVNSLQRGRVLNTTGTPCQFKLLHSGM